LSLLFQLDKFFIISKIYKFLVKNFRKDKQYQKFLSVLITKVPGNNLKSAYLLRLTNIEARKLVGFPLGN